MGLAPGSRACPVLRVQDSAVLCGLRAVSGSRACCIGAAFIAFASLKVLNRTITKRIVGEHHRARLLEET